MQEEEVVQEMGSPFSDLSIIFFNFIATTLKTNLLPQPLRLTTETRLQEDGFATQLLLYFVLCIC